MSDVLIKQFASKFKKNIVPVEVGQRVKVHQKVVEGNKERVQVFDGLVIKKRAGRGTDASFTVRKISEGVGVEKIFPLHSPTVTKIEIIRQHKVKRSKLYFMRDRFGKAARLKEDKSFVLKEAENRLISLEETEKKLFSTIEEEEGKSVDENATNSQGDKVEESQNQDSSTENVAKETAGETKQEEEVKSSPEEVTSQEITEEPEKNKVTADNESNSKEAKDEVAKKKVEEEEGSAAESEDSTEKKEEKDEGQS